MASLLGIAGGIAASPFRAAGGIAKGTAKLGYAGLKATAFAAADVSGALPFFAAAAGITKGVKKGITAGYDVGKKLLKPVGEGTVSEDSAIKAIAAAASETAKIQAETAKIEAETEELTGGKKAEKAKAIAKTTMGGVDVEILEKIYGEVVSIRDIVGGADPESEKKELALDEQTRHKKFLAALAALGFGGKEKKDKGPGFFGDLLEGFKGLLTGIIAGLGLAGLIKFWPQLVTAFETIVDAIANINEFITDMKNFFMGAWDWLTNVDAYKNAGALAAAARAARMTALEKARNRPGSHRTYKRGTPERKLTKGQDKLKKANELVKKRKLAEANRLKKVAAQNKLRLANEAKARKIAGMKGPITGAASSTKALTAYKRAISTTASTTARGGTSRGGGMAEVEARSNLRWRTSVGNYIQSKMAKLGLGLAEYNVERKKAAQLRNTQKFLEASRKSEMKLRKVVVRAFTGETIMTKAQIEGMQAKQLVKTGKNVLQGSSSSTKIYDAGAGQSNLDGNELKRLQKAGFKVVIRPAPVEVGGVQGFKKVTVHAPPKGTGPIEQWTPAQKLKLHPGGFVSEGNYRQFADTKSTTRARVRSAGLKAAGLKGNVAVSENMVSQAKTQMLGGKAGKVSAVTGSSKFSWGTRLFGSLAIGYHLAKQMGDYYVDTYLVTVAQVKIQLKRKLGREPLPAELKANPTVVTARKDLQQFFHTICIKAASGIIVGALMAKVGAIIGAKVGAWVGGMGANPASVALGIVIGGIVGGIVFAVIGFVAGEHIAGVMIADMDMHVGGNFIPSGEAYMPDGVLNVGNWYAGYLIRKEDANMEAMRRKQVAEAKLQKDQELLRNQLGMGKDLGMGTAAWANADLLTRKSKTAEGLTEMEAAVLREYHGRRKQAAAEAKKVEISRAKTQMFDRTGGGGISMGADYSQTTPKKKEKSWFQKAKDTAAGFLGFGGDDADAVDDGTVSVFAGSSNFPNQTSGAARIAEKSLSTDPYRFGDDEPYSGSGSIGGGSGSMEETHPGQALGHSPPAKIAQMQTNLEEIGTALNQAGANGGVLKADVIVTNINSTTNSDHQQVSSTASTSNVITFDSNTQSVSKYRSRYA